MFQTCLQINGNDKASIGKGMNFPRYANKNKEAPDTCNMYLGLSPNIKKTY